MRGLTISCTRCTVLQFPPQPSSLLFQAQAKRSRRGPLESSMADGIALHRPSLKLVVSYRYQTRREAMDQQGQDLPEGRRMQTSRITSDGRRSGTPCREGAHIFRIAEAGKDEVIDHEDHLPSKLFHSTLAFLIFRTPVLGCFSSPLRHLRFLTQSARGPWAYNTHPSRSAHTDLRFEASFSKTLRICFS